MTVFGERFDKGKSREALIGFANSSASEAFTQEIHSNYGRIVH